MKARKAAELNCIYFASRMQFAETLYRSDDQFFITVSLTFMHSSCPCVTKLIEPLVGGTLGDTACNMIMIVHIQIFIQSLEQAVPFVLVSY
jgi:hypothetical protein